LSVQPWKGISLLINWKGSVPEMKEVADSPALFKFMEELLEYKDMDTRIQWLKNQIERLT